MATKKRKFVVGEEYKNFTGGIVNEILDIRTQCMSGEREMMSIIIPPGGPKDMGNGYSCQKIAVLRGKKSQNVDDIICLVFLTGKFLGRVRDHHPVWEKILRHCNSYSYYGVVLSDGSRVESAAVKGEDIIPKDLDLEGTMDIFDE